ncbi:MAG: SRPBCC family protein, partial [Bacteroidota bacterium]
HFHPLHRGLDVETYFWRGQFFQVFRTAEKGPRFGIKTPVQGVEMYEGMAIQYRVSPFPGVGMDWVTEITKIVHHEYFVDDQRVGPFALWHHQHHFKALDDSRTEMTDILHYQAPLGPLGTLADWLFVHRQVRGIFTAREEAIERLFPA